MQQQSGAEPSTRLNPLGARQSLPFRKVNLATRAREGRLAYCLREENLCNNSNLRKSGAGQHRAPLWNAAAITVHAKGHERSLDAIILGPGRPPLDPKSWVG